MVSGFRSRLDPPVRASLGRLLDRVRRVVGGGERTAETDAPSETDGEDERPADVAALEAEAELARYRPDAADFDRLIDALDRPEPAAREIAAMALAKAPATALSRATRAVTALARRLDDDHLAVRRFGAKALARIAPAAPDEIRAQASTLVEHVDAYNLRISGNVAAALAEAAASHPDDVAPLVFEHVAVHERTSTRRNALIVVERAARSSPDAVEPVVPVVVELVDRGLGDTAILVRTLAAVSEEFPDRVAPAVPALARIAERGDPEAADGAIEALGRLALEDPGAARPALPVLVRYLTEPEQTRADLAAAAIVRIVDRRPRERDRLVEALETVDDLERLRVARALDATDTDLGSSLAEEVVEGSSLSRYVGR